MYSASGNDECFGEVKPRKEEAGEACKNGILFGVAESLQKDLSRVREHGMGTFGQRDCSQKAA